MHSSADSDAQAQTKTKSQSSRRPLAKSIDIIKWMRMNHVFVRNLSKYLPQLNICVPTFDSKLVPVYTKRLVEDGHIQVQARGDKLCNHGL